MPRTTTSASASEFFSASSASCSATSVMYFP
jgi:hypothetical protein